MTNELRERAESAVKQGKLTIAYAREMIEFKEKSLESWTNGRFSYMFEARYEIVRLNSDIAYFKAVIEILEEQEALSLENGTPLLEAEASLAEDEAAGATPAEAVEISTPSGQKYNKSEVMKYAWKIFKGGDCTFSNALRFSWKKAKEAFNTDTVADLQAGDIVEMSIADTFQKASLMRYTVESISKTLVRNRFYAVKFKDWYGRTTEYFMEPDSKMNIVVKAPASKKAA